MFTSATSCARQTLGPGSQADDPAQAPARSSSYNLKQAAAASPGAPYGQRAARPRSGFDRPAHPNPRVAFPRVEDGETGGVDQTAKSTSDDNMVYGFR